MTLYPQNLFTFPQSPLTNLLTLSVNSSGYLKFSTFNTVTVNTTYFYNNRLVLSQYVERLGIIGSKV